MDVRHHDAELDRIEAEPEFTGRLDPALVRSFRKVLNVIRGVVNETELYQWRSLRFEKLKGKRAHQRSMRLNDQWRLIVELEKHEGGNTVVVKGIEDYHR